MDYFWDSQSLAQFAIASWCALYISISAAVIEQRFQISLGEMVTLLPIPGGHIKLAERFVDPALSLTLGWFYWYNWTIGIPAELSALAVLMQFWKSVSLSIAQRNDFLLTVRNSA